MDTIGCFVQDATKEGHLVFFLPLVAVLQQFVNKHSFFISAQHGRLKPFQSVNPALGTVIQVILIMNYSVANFKLPVFLWLLVKSNAEDTGKIVKVDVVVKIVHAVLQLSV